MRREGKALFAITVLAMIYGLQSAAICGDNKLAGMIIGRSGEVLHISVPQPVKEGTLLAVRPISSEPVIAEARVLSCTRERPFIALAKVESGDAESSVPIGAHVYADSRSVQEGYAPKPIKQAPTGNTGRFSIQTGTFYPTTTSLRDTVSNYWQSYRLNYSTLKVGGFDALLSAEYNRGTGAFTVDGSPVRRTMEIMPVTLLGRIRSIRTGGVRMYLGAGAGIYQLKSSDRTDTQTVTDTISKFGREYALGFESRHGWVMELRYRDVQDTDVRGYSLGIGAKF